MKTLKVSLGIAAGTLVAIGMLVADPLAPAVSGNDKKQDQGKVRFVTGSNIPQRVKVKAIGTNTTSPVRIYTRAEMDRTGQFTTQGILAQDPSIKIIGR